MPPTPPAPVPAPAPAAVAEAKAKAKAAAAPIRERLSEMVKRADAAARRSVLALMN